MSYLRDIKKEIKNPKEIDVLEQMMFVASIATNDVSLYVDQVADVYAVCCDLVRFEEVRGQPLYELIKFVINVYDQASELELIKTFSDLVREQPFSCKMYKSLFIALDGYSFSDKQLANKEAPKMVVDSIVKRGADDIGRISMIIDIEYSKSAVTV